MNSTRSATGSATEYDYLFKFVVTGDASCGKSRIVERYVYNRFSEKSHATIGVEFITKNVVMSDETRVRLQIWDTAGTEKYRAITTGHYRSAVGAILVYDITSEESFMNLSYWLESLRDSADEHLVVALMPNKSDIMFKKPEQREVMREQGQIFAKENNLIYIEECSALADIGIKDVFSSLIHAVIRVQSELVRKGLKESQALRIKDEDLSMHYQHRCCY